MLLVIRPDENTVATFLYVISKLGKEMSDMHSVFKTLYFADRNHLANYGRMIISDQYIAMNDGPVPSLLYDGCKESRSSDKPYCGLFKMDGKAWKIRHNRQISVLEIAKAGGAHNEILQFLSGNIE